jgi:hypothetical protein
MTNKEMMEALGVVIIPVAFEEGSGDWVTDYEGENK